MKPLEWDLRWGTEMESFLKILEIISLESGLIDFSKKVVEGLK